MLRLSNCPRAERGILVLAYTIGATEDTKVPRFARDDKHLGFFYFTVTVKSCAPETT